MPLITYRANLMRVFESPPCMAFSPSRGLLYSGPPEPNRRDDRTAADDERTEASTDAPAPADD